MSKEQPRERASKGEEPQDVHCGMGVRGAVVVRNTPRRIRLEMKMSPDALRNAPLLPLLSGS